MNKKNKDLIVTTILSIILLLSLTVDSFPIFFGNWGQCTVEPGCESRDGSSTDLYITQSSGLLKYNIVDGAGYVLNAYSGVGALLK